MTIDFSRQKERITQVVEKISTKAEVKANKTDTGGNFYVYDLYDKNGTLIALNRYVLKNSDEQPFETLTEEEELVLNPPYVEPEDIIYDR